MPRSIASISLDLDDQWTYLKTHGDPSWKNYPSYLSYGIPRILDFLDRHDTKITFFIVAQDATFENNKPYLREIVTRGHDIGNHTVHHDPWLHIYTEQEVQEELSQSEVLIESATGVRPQGFRGPGFSFSDTVLKVLLQRGYKYDASTFPNLLNPLARMYFLWSSKLSKSERETRKGLFGSWKDGLRPNKPYYWEIDRQGLLEIPVTTMPLFKIPIHASYVIYISVYSYPLAIAYFRFALLMCKLTRVQPSILLHPLDFIGCDDTADLAFFPAMRIPAAQKIRVMDTIFRLLKEEFRCITMQEHAEILTQQFDLSRLPLSKAKATLLDAAQKIS